MVSRDVADVDDVNRVYNANVIQVDFEYILWESESVQIFKCGSSRSLMISQDYETNDLLPVCE